MILAQFELPKSALFLLRAFSFKKIITIAAIIAPTDLFLQKKGLVNGLLAVQIG